MWRDDKGFSDSHLQSFLVNMMAADWTTSTTAYRQPRKTDLHVTNKDTLGRVDEVRTKKRMTDHEKREKNSAISIND